MGEGGGSGSGPECEVRSFGVKFWECISYKVVMMIFLYIK